MATLTLRLLAFAVFVGLLCCGAGADLGLVGRAAAEHLASYESRSRSSCALGAADPGCSTSYCPSFSAGSRAGSRS